MPSYCRVECFPIDVLFMAVGACFWSVIPSKLSRTYHRPSSLSLSLSPHAFRVGTGFPSVSFSPAPSLHFWCRCVSFLFSKFRWSSETALVRLWYGLCSLFLKRSQFLTSTPQFPSFHLSFVVSSFGIFLFGIDFRSGRTC